MTLHIHFFLAAMNWAGGGQGVAVIANTKHAGAPTARLLKRTFSLIESVGGVGCPGHPAREVRPSCFQASAYAKRQARSHFVKDTARPQNNNPPVTIVLTQHFLAIRADQIRWEWMFAGIVKIHWRIEPAAIWVIAHSAPQALEKYRHRKSSPG
jgi:hypothetical protein